MTREKRAYTRITLDIPASLCLYQMETSHVGAITNISLGGCYFPFDDKLPVGEKCEITITVGEGLHADKVAVSGTIVRQDAQGIGICFTDTSPACRLQLEKIISREMSL
jgi:hypothetical protein